MRYAYVTPTPQPTPRAGLPLRPALTVVLKPTAEVGHADAVVPAEARRLVLAGREAHPGWRFKLTHSVTLSDSGRHIVDHVFIRVYRRSDGEPLGYCGWTAGHTVGGRIWGYNPGSSLRFPMVNSSQFEAWCKGVAYLPPAPADRGTCPVCGRGDVRVKNDGAPYAHRDQAIGNPCVWRIPHRLIERAA